MLSFHKFIFPMIIQCPCIGNVQTGCLHYDSRYQAMTLEEAMASFPDLTQDQDISNPTTLEDDAKCETQECLDCQRDLRKKLAEVGLLPAAIDQAIAAQGNYTTCKKYSFSKDEDEDDGNNHFNISIDYAFILDDSNEVDDGKKKKRYRRQTPPVQTTTNSAALGTIYTLSCTKKGAVVDGKGYVSLCSSCWVWRKLPDNYSPQYINELICDNADGSCLSGYATCSLGERTLEVSRNDNGMMTKVALASGSYCESQSCNLIRRADCDEGWVGWGAYCYKAVVKRLTFNKAVDSCIEMGAQLASMESDLEVAFIASLTETGKKPNLQGMTWIGLKKDDPAGGWYWIDGQQIRNFTVWSKGEPKSPSELYCGILLSDIYKNGSTTYHHTWMSVDCNLSQRAYVCKKPKLTTVVTWPEGENLCQTLGANLASIASQEENNFAYNLTFTATGTENGFDHQVWIGVRRNIDNGSSTNWKLIDGTDATYLPWGSGEPDDLDSFQEVKRNVFK
ncbi:hypothetical protein WR25_03606 isoform A [Diploscapter pachys]|uniref:C-type lectin domain-containing protein n=1 Tax=Diploscapter pachys TaxID=2018661 RepID=A0A2A2KCI1_9BILA|nr:hypothetical protein WR25_03606 isoform A [Diploscapter pachys]